MHTKALFKKKKIDCMCIKNIKYISKSMKKISF